MKKTECKTQYKTEANNRKMQERNKGSAIMEVTLLIPVFLGCIYFFIMFFLFLINSGKKMSYLCEELYSVEITDAERNLHEAKCGDIKKEGTVLKIYYKEQGKWFDYDLLLKRNGNDKVKNIRRWQLAAGML